MSGPTVPDDCQCEMKRRDLTTLLVTVETHKPNLTEIINPERYSSSHKLFHVTALMLKFISRLRGRVTRDGPLPSSDVILTPSDLDSTGSRIHSPICEKTRGSLPGGANLTYLLMGMGCGDVAVECPTRVSPKQNRTRFYWIREIIWLY